MTICNVCTLNLRQANHALQNDAALLARVNENLVAVGAPSYSGGVEVISSGSSRPAGVRAAAREATRG